MADKANITAILLAGGKSSRMGTDKGLMMIRGKYMISCAVDAVKSVTQKIMILCSNSRDSQLGYPVYADEIKNYGPLGWIYTDL